MRSSGNLINLTQPFMTDETFEIKPVQNLLERSLLVKRSSNTYFMKEN